MSPSYLLHIRYSLQPGYLLVILSVFCFLLLPFTRGNASSSLPEKNETEKRYQEAKFYYNELQNSSPKGASRTQWQRGAHNFRAIYLAHPKSTFAAPCLFMLARLSGDMYELFQQPEDLEDSITYYKDVTRLFSNNYLADDAYYALADLALNKRNSPRKAADYLTRIVERYPNSDMLPKAEKQLKYLSKEHNIPLPKIMMAPSSRQGTKLNYILPLKYWSSDEYTRILIFASSPVNYQETLLPQNDSRPARLFIDFQNSYIEPRYRAPIPIKNGLLKQVRTGQHSEDTVRVVLDIDSIASYRIFNLPDPFRVVIDVRGKQGQPDTGTIVADHLEPVQNLPAEREAPLSLKPDKTKRKKTAAIRNAQETPVILRDAKKIHRKKSDENTLPTHQETLSLAQQLGLGVKKIVLDPGHGGKDPGAMAYGLKEKDVVLRLGRYLAPILRQEIGCEVVLTRDTDLFIPLEERTAIANTQGADLFISLHVNAHPLSKIRGMETYYLNLSTNAEAMRVAAMENATSTHQMSDLQNILADILKNSKISESARLAGRVQQAIVQIGKSKDYPGIRNLGVKQAPFYVLIGAEMPAILIETAFITNKEDADNLKNPTFLQDLARQIAAGVKSYIEDIQSNGTASLEKRDKGLEVCANDHVYVLGKKTGR